MKTICFFFLSVTFLLSSCKGQTQPVVVTKAEQTSAENDTVKLITATAGLQKKYPAEYAYFKKQKDRFEFQECKLYYNGQQLKLDTLQLVERILGKNHVEEGNYWYMDKPISLMTEAKWSGLPFAEGSEIVGEIATSLSIKLTQYDDAYNPTKRDSLMRAVPILDGYVLINGVPVNAEMNIEEVNRRITAEGHYNFVPNLSNYSYARIYSATGFGLTQCSPDPRVENAVTDLVYVSISLSKDYLTPLLIHYTYRIDPKTK